MTVSGPVAESLAGRGAGKVAARRNRGGAAGRVGWPTYLILGVVLLLSAYPLYYSFLLGSSDAATIAREPVPSLIPQGNFLDNVVRVVSSDIKFWQALANSIFVSALTAVSVVFFSTLAGYSFSKPHPAQRGPAVHPDGQTGLDGQPGRGDRARPGHGVRGVLDDPVPRIGAAL
jgi:cellobiose transport system permease protein